MTAATTAPIMSGALAFGIVEVIFRERDARAASN